MRTTLSTIKIGPSRGDIWEDLEYQILSMKHFPIIIGLTGPAASGKTLVARKLVTEYGFKHVSLSDYLEVQATMLGIIQPGWKEVGELAKTLRQQYGLNFLAKVALEEIKKQDINSTRFVVDSLLHTEEIRFLTRKAKMKLLAVSAEREVRVKQFQSWFNIPIDEARITIHERDRYENVFSSSKSIFEPNVYECCEIAKYTKTYCHSTGNIASAAHFEPIDQVLQRLLTNVSRY